MNYFTKAEKVLWVCSVIGILAAFFLFDRENYMTLVALVVLITWLRNPYQGNNDLILILLWTLAAMENSMYISVVVCFMAFFVNDMYGFWSWREMEKRQAVVVWEGK